MSDKVQIVSQYGILGEIEFSRQFSVKSPYWDEIFPLYSQFFTKYGLSPVCQLYENQYCKEKQTIFLKTDISGVILSTLPKEKEMEEILFDLAKVSPLAFRILFDFGALRYHLSRLVKTYIEVSADFSHILTIPKIDLTLENKDLFVSKKLCPKWVKNVPVSKIGAYVLSGDYPETIFYEMTAYLTAARTLLDSLIRLFKALPSIRRSANAPTEKSFRSFVEKMASYALPVCLENLINENRNWVFKLIDYRDCLLHYEILSPSSLPYLMVIHSENSLIAVQTWLPDNPETKSRHKYEFEEHIEYLSYAHATYIQLIDFVFDFSKCILSGKLRIE